jgi:hypothetical protein
VVSFTLRPLYPQGNSPWYPLDRRLGGPQNRSGRGGEEKNSQPPAGEGNVGVFSPSHRLKTGSRAHIAFSPMGTGGEAEHSHLVPRLRISGAIPPLPTTSSWRAALLSTVLVCFVRVGNVVAYV